MATRSRMSRSIRAMARWPTGYPDVDTLYKQQAREARPQDSCGVAAPDPADHLDRVRIAPIYEYILPSESGRGCRAGADDDQPLSVSRRSRKVRLKEELTTATISLRTVRAAQM